MKIFIVIICYSLFKAFWLVQKIWGVNQSAQTLKIFFISASGPGQALMVHFLSRILDRRLVYMIGSVASLINDFQSRVCNCFSFQLYTLIGWYKSFHFLHPIKVVKFRARGWNLFMRMTTAVGFENLSYIFRTRDISAFPQSRDHLDIDTASNLVFCSCFVNKLEPWHYIYIMQQ